MDHDDAGQCRDCWCKRATLPLRRDTKARYAKIAQLIEDGASVRETAAKVGVSMRAVVAVRAKLREAASPQPPGCTRCGLHGEHVCLRGIVEWAESRPGAE
jgi:hypothetical protein